MCLGLCRLPFCVCIAEKALVPNKWCLAGRGTACWQIDCSFTQMKTRELVRPVLFSLVMIKSVYLAPCGDGP